MTTAIESDVTELDGTVDSVAERLIKRSNPPEERPQEPQDEADEPLVPEDDDPEYDVEAEDDVEEQDDPDAEDDDGQDEEPEDTQKFTVKVDGEEVEATLEDLKRSFAGQGYIQKRMQEVASVRKEAETVYTALNEERAQLAQVLQAYTQHLDAGLPTPPSKDLLATDPIGYLEQEVAYREAVEKRQSLQEQQQALLAEQSQRDSQAFQAYLRSQAEDLTARIPDILDAKKAPVIMRKLGEAGQAYGYNAAELKQLVDARAINVLYDASRWRELQASKGKIREKVEQSRTVKPGARREVSAGKTEVQKLRSRMKASGRVDDVAALLIAKATAKR